MSSSPGTEGRRRARRGRVAVVLGAAAIALAPATVVALHRETPLLLRITTAPSQQIGTQRWLGNTQLLLFDSDADLLGTGNGVSQIFLFDLQSRVEDRAIGLRQLTFGERPSRAGSGAKRGEILAYETLDDLLGYGWPGWQIVLERPARAGIGRGPRTQLTCGAGESTSPLVNDLAKYVFFTSTLDLLQRGLVPGRYLYRAEMSRVGGTDCPCYPCAGNPGLELVAPVAAGRAAIDAAGDRVVFESSGDVLGDGSTNGHRQLFLKVFSSGSVRMLTGGNGDSRHPTITADGTLVAFESDADASGQALEHTQVFLIDLAAPDAPATQLTFGSDGDSTAPAMTLAGDRLAFSSTASLTDSAAPGGAPRVYFVELAGPRTTALVAGELGAVALQYSFVTLPTTTDLDGSGGGLHLYLLNTFAMLGPPPTPRPTITATRTATPLAETSVATMTPTPIQSGGTTPTRASTPKRTRTPTPMPTAVRTPVAPTLSLVGCQRGVFRAVRRRYESHVRTVERCAARALACVVTKAGAARDACMARVRARCHAIGDAWSGEPLGAFAVEPSKHCAVAAVPIADLFGNHALGYGDLAELCETSFGVPVRSLPALLACLRAATVCGAEQTVAAGAPRAAEVLQSAGVPQARCLGLGIEDAEGQGMSASAQAEPPADGAALARCQAVLAAAAGAVGRAALAALDRCIDDLLRCELEGGDGAACARARPARCDLRLLVATSRGSSIERQRVAIERACAGVGSERLAASAGLGLERYESLCAAVGVAELGGAREVAQCTVRLAYCSALETGALGFRRLDGYRAELTSTVSEKLACPALSLR